METEVDETEAGNPIQIAGRYYWSNLMVLTDRDLTKLEIVLKLPTATCLNFLAEAKDMYEKEKKELNKLKSRIR